MQQFCLSFGSNVGNRLHNIKTALRYVENEIGELCVSPIVQTQAIVCPGTEPQRDYYNMIGFVRSNLSPMDLLDRLKQIEKRMGRDLSAPKWSARVIDLDILFCETATGDEILLDNDVLSLPHPELCARPFLTNLLIMFGYPYDFVEDVMSVVVDARSNVVGIVNVTPDSFSDGGMYIDVSSLHKRIDDLYEFADIIEFGAQSTRPGYSEVSEHDERRRLQPALEYASCKDGLRIGVDTYFNSVINFAMDCCKIAWSNDIYSRYDRDTLQRIAKNDMLHVVMANSNNVQHDLHVEVERVRSCGIDDSNIVIDYGLGFSKNIADNWREVHAMISHKYGFQYQVLLGHSRKSFFRLINDQHASERDVETLALSAALYPHVDYFRVHNVALHMRFLKTFGFCASYTNCKSEIQR